MTKETVSFLEDVPENLRGRVLLLEGVLHMSSELKGNLEMITFVATLRKRGIQKYSWHNPQEFDREYGSITSYASKGQNEIQKMAIELIAKAHAMGASDIHIADFGRYCMLRFRVLGALEDHTQLEGETGRMLISSIYQNLSQSADSCFTPSERQDGRIVNRDFLPNGVHSVRLHTEPIDCVHGTNGVGTVMAMRLLYDSTSAHGSLPERMHALGFTPEHSATAQFLTKRTGLTIISGPTGHGKSTFLKHIMESMTESHPERSYYSIEDPPEYPLKGVMQIRVSTTMNADSEDSKRTRMYTGAIAGTMRADPDTLMIGEIRYAEAALAAIDAALTGHAVFATLHANNAFGIITRLISSLKSVRINDPLSLLCDPNVLAGLAYQRLLALLCPHCKRRYNDLNDAEKAAAIAPDLHDRLIRVVNSMDNVHVLGPGCTHCAQRGKLGQTVAAEIVATDQVMLRYLRENDIPRAYEYWVSEKHGRSYVDHAVELIEKGLVDPALTEERLGVPLNFNKVFMAQGAL